MFRRSFLIALLAMPFALNSFAQEGKDKPEFKEGDRIVITFGADWCGYCKMLVDMVESSDVLQKFIKEKYTGGYWYLKEGQTNAKRWFDIAMEERLLRGYPTTVIFVIEVKEDGTLEWAVHSSIVGMRSEKQFLEFLQKGLEDK